MFKSSKAISNTGKYNKVRPGDMVTSFAFLLAGFGVLLVAIKPALEIKAAKDWPSIACRIISSEVKDHRSSGDGGSTYSILIQYEYQYNNKTYTSNRYSFFTGSSSDRDGKTKIVAEYPPGKVATCYVNPDHPYKAVINRQFTGEIIWFSLISLIFVAVGLGGIIYGVLALIIKRRPLVHHPSTRKYPDQPATLQAQSNRQVKLIVAICCALFCNGIVGVFVYAAFKSFIADKPNWLLTLLLIPFVVVGLRLIVGVFYYDILAIFNPRPILTINRNGVPRGDTLELVWDISGKAHRISNLLVTLEGTEHATYRRRTDTVTEKHTFAEIELYKNNDIFSMAHGSASINIPASAMHSFEANNNKIIWTIHFHGDVRRWPDVDVHFPIEILPAVQGDHI